MLPDVAHSWDLPECFQFSVTSGPQDAHTSSSQIRLNQIEFFFPNRKFILSEVHPGVKTQTQLIHKSGNYKGQIVRSLSLSFKKLKTKVDLHVRQIKDERMTDCFWLIMEKSEKHIPNAEQGNRGEEQLGFRRNSQGCVSKNKK